MSQPWKSELLLRLKRGSCIAQVLAPWSRRVVREMHAEGPIGTALPQLLKALQEEGETALPRQARLMVPDELAYLSLRPPCADWPTARQEAQSHFMQTLGRQDLVTQVVPLPVNSGWLAAAIEPADLQAWQQMLAQAGVRLAHVELALLDDLQAIASLIGNEAVVALLRDEGMTLVRVSGGTLVELNWERCDTREQRLVEQRLLAFQGGIHSSTPEPLWLVCRSAAQCELWQRLALGHQWTLLARESAAQPATAASDAGVPA